MTRDQHSAPPDNRSASTRRGGERGDRTCAYPGSPGLVPHLDIYGSAPSSMGIGSGTSSGLHNGGSSHNGRMTEAFNLHDVHHRGPNGRPLSLPANSGARGIHQWDPRAAGSGTPIPPGSRSGRASPLQLSESAWLQEVERRRREMGYRGSVDGEHRIGAGHEREHDRRMPQERQRSMQHLERRHANGGGGVDDQVRLPWGVYFWLRDVHVACVFSACRYVYCRRFIFVTVRQAFFRQSFVGACVGRICNDAFLFNTWACLWSESSELLNLQSLHASKAQYYLFLFLWIIRLDR